MYVDISQVLSLLAKLDPGLTKEFLISTSIPLVLCSGGIISPFNVFEVGFPLSAGVLPIYNTICAWRGGIALSPPILLYNAVISLHGIVLTTHLQKRKTNADFVKQYNTYIVDAGGIYAHLKRGTLGVKLFTWFGISAEMAAWNVIPYLYTMRGDGSSPTAVLGLSLVALGSIIQAVADHQKGKHKAIHGPESFCREGLYKWCRHPNYLGEIIFHFGILISGFSLFPSVSRWLLIGIAPAFLGSMMFFVTHDMAKKQAAKYASDTNYEGYQSSVKKLIPYVW